MTLEQVTIVGAGLIGGSLASAARNAGLAGRFVAIDTRAPPSVSHPFDDWVEGTKDSHVSEVLAESSLTFVCVPVGSIITITPKILSLTSGVVTDCGSTKAALLASLGDSSHRARFVGGHPMAGHPEGGIENARADLFVDRKWILCPEGSDPSAVSIVRDFVSRLGAQVVELSADEHDKSVAVTSHVPQVVASALSVYAVENDALRAAGPGFASATRVAGGAEAMWRDIFETNAPEIGHALVDLGKRLTTLGRQLENLDKSGTLNTLEQARKYRKSVD